MENPNKTNGYGGGGGEEGEKKKPPPPDGVIEAAESTSRPPLWDSLLRLLATALTLSAALISGLASQTRHVPLTTASLTVQPLTIAVTAKGRYLSSTVFFTAANCIACCHAAASCVVSAKGGRRAAVERAVRVADVLMVALLAAAGGAAGGVGVIAYRGNRRLRWNGFCDVFASYCQLEVVALVLSLLAAALFVLLVLLRSAAVRS